MWNEVVKRIEEFIREKVRNANAKGVVFGLSGGVDSTVVAYLCKRALKKDEILALIMPEEGVTSKEDLEDAVFVAETLEIKYKIIEISDFVKMLVEKLGEGRRMSVANLKPRIRMIMNYYYANELNYLVVGTSNKSEIMIGYFTKFGDGAADFMPIGDLYKTEVWELAKFLGVPEKIIRKKPTAGLWVGQTDEDEIGMSYFELDEILKAIERGEKRCDEKFKKVEKMIKNSQHKRSFPEILKLRDLLC
ncbi:MAG: NAD+ synthase [Archaeoglobaceae archaeon]|nr:NAD+ synthase [Archaeoglobaceae archaeon]MCX8152587.1 NAD+ synthase [Archaeoglobaceae archaeon]MDW8014131.1 NAD+ synthase [Archaeoglobaceae archaeon]